jgi:hypothetical protein
MVSSEYLLARAYRCLGMVTQVYLAAVELAFERFKRLVCYACDVVLWSLIRVLGKEKKETRALGMVL